VREIRTLRAKWRGLETESRTTLHGHEEGNPGYRRGKTYGLPRQSSTLPALLAAAAIEKPNIRRRNPYPPLQVSEHGAILIHDYPTDQTRAGPGPAGSMRIGSLETDPSAEDSVAGF
jgi:hypothetical protein